MKPIRVLVLITVLDRAGAETVAMNYMRNIDRDKIKYDFLVNRPERSPYEDEVEALGGKVYHMGGLYPGNIHKYKREFREFLKGHPYYQVIHSHLEERSYFALKIAEEMGVPIRICHGHSHPNRLNVKLPARYCLKYLVRRHCTHTMACSKEVAEWLFGKSGATRAKIMKNAIDTSMFKADPEIAKAARQEFGFEDKLVVGHVGRFTPVKNQRFLIDIFAEIHRRIPNSVLLLVGGGDNAAENKYREKVKERVKEMRIQDAVVYAGLRDDVHRVMQAMDVLVMPSTSEGFPVTLVEAQSLGIKCVVSDVISQKVNLTGIIQYLPLELRSSVWATRILKYMNKPIKDTSYKVVDKGYDIHNNAKWLEGYYISELKKHRINEAAKAGL